MELTNGESKIRKILFNEVSLMFSVVAVVVTVLLFVMGTPTKNAMEIQRIKAEIEVKESLSKQLQSIKDNDLHSLEVKYGELDHKLDLLSGTMIEIKTILNERLR